MKHSIVIIGAVVMVAACLLPACAEEGKLTRTGPVKIGCITAWSGPQGMSGAIGDVTIDLVEYEINELAGGILGGRQLDLIGCDSRSTTAGCVACANELLYEKDVAAVVWGGTTGADAKAIIDFCEENKLPYFFWGGLPQDLCAYKFAVRCSHSVPSIRTFANDYLKLFSPKTVAGLAYDTADAHVYVNNWMEELRNSGVQVVYEQYYPLGVTDFTPYLTRIKYLNPDLLLIIASNEGYVAMAKQSVGLGGLGDTRVVCDPPGEIAQSEEGAQGWYVYVFWTIGLPYPGSKKLEEDYQALYGAPPTVSYISYYYNCLLAAIQAIELAGTDDREAVAKAAHSGDLVVESLLGSWHYDKCGEPGHIPGLYVQIKDRKVVRVQVPQ